MNSNKKDSQQYNLNKRSYLMTSKNIVFTFILLSWIKFSCEIGIADTKRLSNFGKIFDVLVFQITNSSISFSRRNTFIFTNQFRIFNPTFCLLLRKIIHFPEQREFCEVLTCILVQMKFCIVLLAWLHHQAVDMPWVVSDKSKQVSNELDSVVNLVQS